jgi:hypothetical protein
VPSGGIDIMGNSFFILVAILAILLVVSKVSDD